MSKKVIGGGIIILVIAGLFFFLQNNSSKNNQTEVQEKNTIMSKISTDSGKLQIEEIKEGTGAAVTSGDTVVMHYSGTLENGTKFDSSYDRGEPFETRIGVGQVIEGWDMGVPGMKIGGKRKLVIPSALGYGERGVGPIPPNATLIFEVELLDIK